MSAVAARRGVELTTIEKTAWLTTFCRHWEGERGVRDEFASFVAARHPEHAPRTIARRTRVGVALRTARLDEQVVEVLGAASEPVCYWALGAGLDARWLRLREAVGDRIAEYREFDYPAILAAKADLVARSPFADAYAKVTQVPGDLLEALTVVPATTRPVLAVAEGLLMYFTEAEQARLFALLSRVSPRVVLVADMYTDRATRQGNRQRRRVLGGVDVRFAWGPRDVEVFVRDQGFRVDHADSLLRPVFDRVVPWGHRLPLPKKWTHSYVLVCASRGVGPTLNRERGT